MRRQRSFARAVPSARVGRAALRPAYAIARALSSLRVPRPPRRPKALSRHLRPAAFRAPERRRLQRPPRPHAPPVRRLPAATVEGLVPRKRRRLRPWHRRPTRAASRCRGRGGSHPAGRAPCGTAHRAEQARRRSTRLEKPNLRSSNEASTLRMNCFAWRMYIGQRGGFCRRLKQPSDLADAVRSTRRVARRLSLRGPVRLWNRARPVRGDDHGASVGRCSCSGSADTVLLGRARPGRSVQLP